MTREENLILLESFMAVNDVLFGDSLQDSE